MPRHPGLQHGMRMKEVQERIERIQGAMIDKYWKMKEEQKKLAALIVEHQKLACALLPLIIFQEELSIINSYNQFGLPTGVSLKDYEKITGIHAS